MNGKIFTFILLLGAASILSCQKKDDVDDNPNSRLTFTTDSISFDTVFTDVGTVTRVLKISNHNNKSINIAELKLAGGNLSNFKININGLPTSSIKDFQIKAKDSAYVFIKAFISPNSENSTFIIEDSLVFHINGTVRKIPLIAYGRNAIYLNGGEISANTTFRKGKPYLIYNHLTVKERTVLNIEAGAKLYFHKGAKLIIKGSLRATGTFTDSITFTSDRMERIYRDESGQWQGLHFQSKSYDNLLNFCTVKNALVGLQIDSLSLNTQPKLLISNCIIKNHEISGILGYNASVTGLNNLLYNCGQYLLTALNGGDYNFYQNTFAGYNISSARSTPAVYIADNSKINPETYPLAANFANNIIWGTISRELNFDQAGQKAFNLNFSNNLIRTNSTTIPGTNNIINQDPLFINPRQENYRLADNSVAIDKGLELSANNYFNILNKDLQDKSRVYPSELGCYEK